MTSSSVRDADGRFLYAVRVQHDITDRKRAEGALARRMEEQAALFAFSERLQHCTSSNDCYEAALDAIARALACERASILLFDETQIMRFAAWRGLSQGYRQAVEGHSPWTPDAHDPQPIGIEDVAKADLPDALRQTVLGEDIRAAAFIPILLDGRLSGKFMAYHRLPHSFSEAEIDVRWSLRDCLALAFPPRRRGSAPGSGTRCASARGDC